MNFSPQHFEWILKAEGGHVNHPDDKGGETKFGISQKAFPDLNIADLTIEDAQALYELHYFNAYRLNELPLNLGLIAFDAFVNHSPKRAAKMLQKAVGATADGVIGSKTIAAANKHNQDTAIENFISERLSYYQSLVAKNSTQIVFLKGWRNRLIRLLQFTYTGFSKNLNWK